MRAKKLFPAASFKRLWNKINKIENEVDNKIENGVDNKINKMLPFKLGVDKDGNYGYIKVGADSVTPFNSSKMVQGTSSMVGYGQWTKVTLGFKPKAVMAYCQSGGGYLITWFYAEGLVNNSLRRSGSVTLSTEFITVADDGFSWMSIDSTWGSQTITYVAIK